MISLAGDCQLFAGLLVVSCKMFSKLSESLVLSNSFNNNFAGEGGRG